MSEEKIIEKIKNTIQYDKEHRIVTIYDEKPLFRDYLQGLLDLYNKEKAKNKEYEDFYGTPPTFENSKYIEKDKIREIISNLEEDLNENNYGEKTTISIKYAIKVLQKLLEERN